MKLRDSGETARLWGQFGLKENFGIFLNLGHMFPYSNINIWLKLRTKSTWRGRLVSDRTHSQDSTSLGTFTFGKYTETRHVFHWKWYLCLYMADWLKLRMRISWGIRQRRHELEFEREIWSNQTLFARGTTEQLSKEWMGLTSDAASKFKLQIRSMCKEKIFLSELLLNFIS